MSHWASINAPTLMLTADGRRLYAQDVLSRLGLKLRTSILAAGAPEHRKRGSSDVLTGIVIVRLDCGADR